MYDPTVGRFITEDPIGFDGGDANEYRYAGNSPTNATDPTGTSTLTVDYSSVQRYPNAVGSVQEQDGTSMSVWVAGNVTLVNEKNARDEGFMQFGAQGPDASKSQWLQFYQTNEYDSNGNLVIGSGSRVGNMFVFDGRWYLDAPPPPANGNADPNSVFYDYPANKNVCIRSSDSVSIYDRASETNLATNISKVVTSFQTYFVCDHTVQWEFTWDFVVTRNANGTMTANITNVKGQAVTDLDGGSVRTRDWVVGSMLENVNGNAATIGKELSYKNPLFTRPFRVLQ